MRTRRFAAGGRYAPLALVQAHPRQRRASEVKLPAPSAPRDVLTPAEAYVLTSMLESVVEEGTGKAKALGRPAAGKTGTSNHARDAWFVGYTPELVAGVWVGFDDHRPLGNKESGAKSALPIWIEVMKRRARQEPAGRLPDAERRRRVRKIDPETRPARLRRRGGRASTRCSSRAPCRPQTALPPDVADPTTFMMEQLGAVALR